MPDKNFAATQTFLRLAEIREGAIVLKNGGLRAVLKTNAINFSLKSEMEQESIIAGYQSFLNALEHPVQLLVKSRKIVLDDYLKKLERRALTQTNPLLQRQTREYTEFVGRLVEVADIMKKDFYVVVPFDPVRVQTETFFEKFMKSLSPGDSVEKMRGRQNEFEENLKKLNARVNTVMSGLRGCQLAVERLDTYHLIELFYESYNPITARKEHLGKLSEMAIADADLLAEAGMDGETMPERG